MTDVLLHLLLQTGHLWPQLGKENLEQLLVILDVNKNPLGDKKGEQESDKEEDFLDLVEVYQMSSNDTKLQPLATRSCLLRR